jgi:hypothetical protein
MGEVSTIGLDIAKWAFHVHGVDVDGTVVIPEADPPAFVNTLTFVNTCDIRIFLGNHSRAVKRLLGFS